MAPYTPTEQEQTLLQAYELTQDNTVAFTFQNPEEILGLFVQIYRLGEDGTWKNVDDIAVGSLLPPQAEGLITLQLEDSEAIIARVLCQGSLQVGSAGPLEGDFVARTEVPHRAPAHPAERTHPHRPAGLRRGREPRRPGRYSGQDLPPGLLHPGKSHRSGPSPGGDGDLLQRSLRKQAPAGSRRRGLLPFPWFVGEVCFFCRSMV